MAIYERKSDTFEVIGELITDDRGQQLYEYLGTTTSNIIPTHQYTIGVYAKENEFADYSSSNFNINVDTYANGYISYYSITSDTFYIPESSGVYSVSAEIYEQYEYHRIVYLNADTPSEHVANKYSFVTLPTPTKDDSTFLYWKDDNGNLFDGGSQYECSTQLLFNNQADCNLTAVWKSNAPATYTISFNANGGSGAPDSVTKTHGVTLTLPNTIPYRSNYTFLGWSTSSTATSPTYYAGGIYTINASATLYAVWSKNVETYTIRFDANGGTDAPDPQTKTHGVTLTLSPNEPERDGYTFLGWSSNPSAFSAQYSAGSTYSNNSSVTLYAIWKLNLIEVDDFIYSSTPLSDTSTGLTLATSNTTCNKNVGVRLNYLDIIKLNNPANIVYGQSLFGIDGSYSGNIIAQSGIVIHDKTSTTIYPFYGSDSELSNITWSVSSEGVAFNTGNRHHRFLNTNVSALIGLNGETDISVGSSNSTHLTADVVKEYKVVYGEGSQPSEPSEPDTPTEGQEFQFAFFGSDDSLIASTTITATEAVLTWEDDGTTGSYNILKINGIEIASDAANSYAGLSVDNDFNVTSLNDIEASNSSTTLTSGTYTYYLYMTNEITN